MFQRIPSAVKSAYIYIIPVLVLALGFGSCNSYQKALKSADYDKKYEIALELYNKKEYQKAFPLLEELVSVYRGTAKAEDIYYYYTYCNYYLDDLISSAYHFEQFARLYSNSPKAEDCLYMSAYCYYLNSPPVSLDQTNTLRAIDQFQMFINQYPQSSRVPECNDLIDKLRAKLERKSYESGMLYYRTMDYKAAIVALKNTLADYPLSQYREEIMYTIVKSHFLLAENSVESKKYERYKNTIDAYSNFIDKFAGSKYAKEAEAIRNKALSRFEALKPTESR